MFLSSIRSEKISEELTDQFSVRDDAAHGAGGSSQSAVSRPTGSHLKLASAESLLLRITPAQNICSNAVLNR